MWNPFTAEPVCTFPNFGGNDTKRCTIANGRGGSHTLERDGFTLSSLPMHLMAGFDLYDPDVCRTKMYPICESAVRANFPDCAKVVVFDHLLMCGVGGNTIKF